jgi:hypothetical protein
MNVNYTVDQVNELVAAYAAAQTDEARAAVVTEYAEKFEKTVASVRAKLVNEKVYVAKQANVKSRKVARKSELVAQLAELMNESEEVLESFEKVNRVALERVVGRLRALSETDEAA